MLSLILKQVPFLNHSAKRFSTQTSKTSALFRFRSREYRSQIEPFQYSLKAIGISCEVDALPSEEQNVYTPVLLLNSGSRQNNSLRGFYAVTLEIERQLSENSTFLKHYALSAQNNTEVFTLYEKILESIANSKQQSNHFEQNRNQIEKAIYSLNEQRIVSQKLSLAHLVLYEALRLLEDQHQLPSKVPQNLQDFMLDVELSEFLQQHLFEGTLLTQPFHPQIRNKNKYFQAIIEHDTDKFTMYANVAGASYRYYQQAADGAAKEPIFEYTEHVPFSVLPYNIEDAVLFNKTINKCELWNRLIYELSLDKEFIEKNYGDMQDDFVQRHLGIWRKALATKNSNQTSLAIIRNDMMYDARKKQWFQIEFNTFSVAFVHISDTLQELQQGFLNSDMSEFAEHYQQLIVKNGEISVDAVEQGHLIYKEVNKQSLNAVVLLVVGERDGNQYDQRFIEFGLSKRGITVFRRNFKQIKESYSYNSADGTLLVEGREVSVIFFRNGYAPDHFQSEGDWKMREDLELSRAVKLPNIALSLVNFKKAQQALQNEGVLDRFLRKIFANSVEEQDKARQAITENFAQIHGFDGGPAQQEKIMQLARNDAKSYVLKPQREGGSNNFYGEDILRLLEKLTAQEREAYILMERVRSRPRCGFLVRKRKLDVAAVVAEIGFIGYFCGTADGGDVLRKNVTGGYLCRTKRFLENEGGVAAGYAVIDSVCVKK